MAHRFTVKQIAAQAGVGTATVDRVLHGRPGVKTQTVTRVHSAMRELEEQLDARLPLGFGLHVDMLMQAPRRFSDAVRTATVAAAASLRPLRVAPRFHLHESISAEGLAAQLRRIARRGTRGILLKATDEPPVVAAVNDVVADGTPVVTLMTDLPDSGRQAYIGMDNRAAGRTAGFLLGRFMGPEPGTVLANISSEGSQGEAAREAGFREVMGHGFPHLAIHDIVGGLGLDRETRRLTREVLAAGQPIAGVYSMGGGNHGIVRALADAGCRPRAFVGHDLDAANRALLADGAIDAVVDHDLETDARTALMLLLRHHRGRPVEAPPPSRAVVVTRWNL